MFSPFWRLESKIKVLAGLVSSEASFLGLQMAAFLLCPLCVYAPGALWRVQIFSSYEDTSQVGLRLKPHFNVIISLKTLSSHSHWGRLGLQHMDLEGNTVQPIIIKYLKFVQLLFKCIF